jgi:D-cysteine desulfhydrase
VAAAPTLDDVALLAALPALARRAPWVRLGEWPTPVEPLPAIARDLWVKRDDLSGRRYGGNKVRTLEALFGQAREAGATRIWATGAVGSNHALATVMHAPDAGLQPGVMLFPQPPTACARDNLIATLGQRPALRPLLSWATLPWAILDERRRPGSYVMVPGGATPEGALGYVSAALELAAQVAAGRLPPPRQIVLGVGSTCTSAGLLAGTAIAARLGLLSPAPRIVSVRVTPWPVTSAFRIVGLAARASALVARLAGDARLELRRGELAPRLTVVGGHIGRGYGYVTAGGLAAIERFRAAGGPPLDTCYSAKAGAGLLALSLDGPTLFWATKSSRPLPPAAPEDLEAAPRRFAHWLARPLSDPPAMLGAARRVE